MRAALLCMILATWLGAGALAQGLLDFDVRFAGESALDEDDLEARARRVFEGLDKLEWVEAAASDAAYLVRLDHIDAGYLGAQVSAMFEEDADGERVLLLSLQPGIRTAWEETNVSGADFVEPETLAAFFDPRRTLVDRALGTQRWFSQSELETAVGALGKFYRAEGFRDSKIELGEPTFSESLDLVTPSVIVTAGARFVCESIEIDGLPEEFDKDLSDLRATLEGTPFTPRRVARFSRALEGRLAAAGWADARVGTETAFAEDGATFVHALVQPKERVQISSIRFEGLGLTRESFVRRLIELDVGDWYDSSEVRAAFSRLLSTGLFQSVDLELEGAGSRRELVATVVESKPIELYVEPGFGSYEGPRLLVGARHKNAFGTGRTVRAEALLSDKMVSAEVGFTDPWWLGDRTVTDISIGYLERDEPSFDFEQLGLEATIRTDFDRHWGLAWTYAIKRSEVVDFDISDPFVLDLLDEVDVASIRVSPRYENRDSMLLPKTGFRSEFSAEWASSAFGSDVDFVRLAATHSHYLKLTEGTVFASNFRTGWIEPSNADELPLQERFFNGGQNTVRSFREGELGPKDAGGEAVGGEVFHLLSVELRQELTERFEGALFFDTGGVSARASEWGDFNDFRSGLGVGVRYLLPIGPLRLDVGFNPDARADEDGWVAQFALGTAY